MKRPLPQRPFSVSKIDVLPDAIGSVELVIDGNGNVEQHTGYYPYSEPWREPAGQPYLFGGKERRRFAGLGDYDFHARFLTTSTALWQTPDLHAGKYPWLSPWVFCAANPIKYVDPTGKDIFEMDRMGNVIERIKTDDYDMLRIMKDDFSFTETSQMAYGTIEKHWQIDGIGGEYDYLQVRGDENGTELLEFLAKNTDVEYAQLKCGEEGEKGLNIIGTSHSTDEDLSAILIIDRQLKNGYNFREYIHNHPSGYLWPSQGDIDLTNKVSKLFNRKPTYKVYTKYAYEGLGNYKTFDNNTERLSVEEFLERHTLIIR